MSKRCFNYDSGEYEDIDKDKDGFSYTQGEYVYNWDDSDYRRETSRKGRLVIDIVPFELKGQCFIGENSLKSHFPIK